MAVYRQGLVIPPTAKVLPPKTEKPLTAKSLPPKKTRHTLFLLRPPKKIPPTIDTAKMYRQLSIPPTEERQLSIPPKRYRQHWIPLKGTAYTGYRPKCTGRPFRVRFLFFVLPGSSSSFSVEPLCVCVDRETPPHLPMHLPPHLPTPRSAWSSRTMSGLEGNRSATNSGVAGSSTNSSVEVGSVAS